jgi:hypothetical protein
VTLIAAIKYAYNKAMKPDPEYLRDLLRGFQDAPGPTTDILQLGEAGLQHEYPRFELHLLFLSEQGLVTSESDDLGIDRAADGCIQWSVVPLRLTPYGHEYARRLLEKAKPLKHGFQ